MKLFKKILMVVGGVVIVLFLVAFTTGFVKGIWDSTSKTSVVKQDTQVTPVVNQDRADFMSTCNSNGDHTTYCGCAWDYLRTNYTIQELIDMGNEYAKTGVFSTGMINASNKCNK